ncbi:MAG: hypothetical protein MUF54_03560, partial [Polyangiaceae bacterium]|nr:hypothetical protein [Polyangiaceae bacterium]
SRALPLLPDDQARARFFLLHRLLRFDSTSGLGDVVEAATSAEAWKELAALYERLAETTSTLELRRAFRLHLANVCEEHIADPNRAFLAQQSLALSAPTADDRAALARLAQATGRWEDLLSVLDAALAGYTTREQRQGLLELRASICEKHLQDPKRAFLELQRLVEGCACGEPDEAEARALAQMHRLAADHGLLLELEAVHSELWDRAPNDDARVRAARARQSLRRDHLRDAAGALEQALLVLRLRPSDTEVAQEVMQESESLGLWTRTLPVLEGVWRAQGDDAGRLVQLAALYRDKCGSTGRAAELLCEALRLAPSHAEALELLDQLGVDDTLWPRVVLATRLAAARTSGTERGLQLAQRVATLYAEKLGDTDASLEVLRWILQVWPDNADALERVIQAHRQAGEHADLRVRLEQWIERVPETSRHVERWLEIGRLCRDHLDDPAGAMLAYSNVLEVDESNNEAIEAMRALGDVSLPTALRRKQVRVELTRATGTRRAELLTRLADVEEQMGETNAAIDALRELFSLESGAEHAGPRLAKTLRAHNRWEELAGLEEEAAAKSTGAAEQLQHLHAALRVTDEHLTDEARQERLLRRVLELDASENDAFASLTRLLRRADRYDDLATELRRRLETQADGYSEIEFRWMRRELVRVLQLTLDKNVDAEAVLRAGLDGASKTAADDALWLAMLAHERRDHAAYIDLRKRHLGKLSARLGALVLCHLAEYCDAHMKTKGRVLALYREARTLDPNNTLANDALRGLGRGVKNWRATASLLTADDEFSVADAERSRRMVALGDAARADNPVAAFGWYERAVAVDPNSVGAWDALMDLALERRDLEPAYAAALEGAYAYDRVTPRGVDVEIAEHAQRLARTASVAGMCDRVADARALAGVAFALDPEVPSAAIMVADARFEAGAGEQACALYSQILDRLESSLSSQQRAHVLHRRGSHYLARADLENANTDLRKAVENDPLFAHALDTMAEVLRKRGQPVNAVLHELKALLVTRDTAKRGLICRRIGDLCDRDLQRGDEAGAWYELAVEAGIEDRGLMNRLLQHYHRTGRTQQALVAIGELIETTTDPMELADLWATRGGILAEHDLDSAEEALDIALSFNPAHPTALGKLREVLEGRGDFEQLAALLDARAESGTPAERADAYRTLARMCFENLGDFPRGETYLQLLVDIEPSREALEQLFTIVRNDPERADEKLPLLSRLLGTGGPYCDRLVAAARVIHQLGNRHWTWAVLSALMGAAPVDPWTKSALPDLRREFERFDSVTLLHPRLLDSLARLPDPDPFHAALSDLCARIFLVTEQDAGAVVDGRTGPGKLFDRVLEQLRQPAKLMRAPDSAEPAGVLSGSVPTVAIRTDLLAAAPGELAFICVRYILLARPACIALASVPAPDRKRIVPALAGALGVDQPSDDPRTRALADTFASMLSADELQTWRELLTDLPATQKKALALFDAVDVAATRVAVVAAGDARTAVRALARISPDSRRPPGVARPEDFEQFFDSLPMIAAVLSFITSEDFAAALPGA